LPFNGLGVFVLAVVLVAVVGAVAASQADAEAIGGNLRSLGIPTTGTEWGRAGTVAGIGSLAAMLVGALLGGVLGERWHSKLTRRAVSGKYRPGRDDQPAERDQEGPGHDQRDRSTDRRDDTGRPASPAPPLRRPQPSGSASRAGTGRRPDGGTPSAGHRSKPPRRPATTPRSRAISGHTAV
jgi:hypothetical protein